MLERTDYTRDVGVEAVELTILPANNCVAGSRLRRIGIGVVQILQNFLLVRHGDAEPGNWNVFHASPQVLHGFRVQAEVDGIHILPAEGCIHEQGRERMGHGVACNAIDAGSCIDLVGAVDVTQHFGRNLPRGGFLPDDCGSEHKDAACAQSQNSSDDSLFAHTEADERVPITFFLEELHHDHVVVQSSGRADDLVEVGLKRFHGGERFFQLPSGAEVMVGENQRGPLAQLLQLLRLNFLRGFKLEIYELATHLRSLGENIEFDRDGATELAPAGNAAASGDGIDVGMVIQELLQWSDGEEGFGQVV